MSHFKEGYLNFDEYMNSDKEIRTSVPTNVVDDIKRIITVR